MGVTNFKNKGVDQKDRLMSLVPMMERVLLKNVKLDEGVEFLTEAAQKIEDDKEEAFYSLCEARDVLIRSATYPSVEDDRQELLRVLRSEINAIWTPI